MTGTLAQSRRTATGTTPRSRVLPQHRAPCRRKGGVFAVLLAVVLTVLVGCGSSGSSSSSGSTTAANGGGTSSAVITIKDFTFTTPASVSPGATVTVHNMDSIAHSVTADTGNTFDSPAQPGDSSFKAPTTPGSYPFHCTPHPEMHGTLVVK